MTYNPAGGKTYTLGASISSTATSITLSSFTLPVSGTPITMAILNTDIAYGTIGPKTSSAEFISFTGITQNANGTATLTGVVRGLDKVSPFTTNATYKLPHSGQSIFILSDAPQVFDEYAAKRSANTFGPVQEFTLLPTSSGGNAVNPNELVTYAQALAMATGTANINRIVVAGNGGEAITAGQLVYLLVTDGEWYKCDADTAATVDNIILGIAQGAGSNGVAITGGVLLFGLDSNQTGLTNNTAYYASNTAGGISSTVGTVEVSVGISRSTTSLLFYPRYNQQLTENQLDAIDNASSPSATNPFLTASAFTGVVTPFAGSAAPTGWLLCDGAAVSRTTYASLFAITSTTFGVGDGSTTFNVPDLRSRIAVGAGTGTKVATFSSRAANVITVTGLSNASNNEFQTGQAVVYVTSGTVITGLTSSTTYYVVRVSNTTFSLATTLANAQNGTVIALSSDGTGTQTFTQTLTARTLGNTGGEENHAMSITELIAHIHPSGTASGSGNVSSGGSPSLGNTGSTGGNVAMNIMQPFAVLNYIIKT